MKNNISQKGFTLVEILVSVFIMSVGFLALSQMEFLSVRQKQMAEEGSKATNLIQFAADRDLGELKRVSLLNAQTFMNERNKSDADYTFCDGSSDSSVCNNCPCNPLARIAPDTSNGTKDTQCAAIGLNDSNIINLSYTTDQDDCLTAYNGLGKEGMFILRKASISSELSSGTALSTIITVNLTYAAKSLKQFNDSKFSLATRDNLTVQGTTILAQIEDYSDTVPLSSGAWGSVVVPFVP